MRLIEESYRRENYVTVSIDATNSSSRRNISYGTTEGFTVQCHVDDLESVIDYMLSKGVGQAQGFALAGHSAGGFACLKLAATKYKSQVNHVLAVAPFFDGQPVASAIDSMDKILHFRNDGVTPIFKKQRYIIDSFLRQIPDIQSHDLYDVIDQLAAPVYLIGGSKDDIIAPDKLAAFAEKVPNLDGITFIEGADHNFKPDTTRSALQNAVNDVLLKIKPLSNVYTAAALQDQNLTEVVLDIQQDRFLAAYRAWQKRVNQKQPRSRQKSAPPQPSKESVLGQSIQAQMRETAASADNRFLIHTNNNQPASVAPTDLILASH